MRAGDRVILYTDGVTEYQNLEGDAWGPEAFYETLRRFRHEPLAEMLESVYQSLQDFGQNAKVQDDVSFFGFEFILAPKG